MKEPVGPGSALLAEVRAQEELTLSTEEFAARTSAPMSEREREAAWALIDWFMRRYPTARERLAYVRRAYAAWTRHR